MVAMMFVALAWQCEDTTILQSLVDDCIENPLTGVINCTLKHRSFLSIPSAGEACLIVKSPESHILSRISISIETLYECEPVVMFHTKRMDFKTLAVKRCAHMGSCVGAACSALAINDTVPELDQANAFLGNSYCISACGSLTCGCPVFWGTACLFYRVYAVPVDTILMPVFRCAAWHPKIKATVNVHSASENVTFTANLTTTKFKTLSNDYLSIKVLNLRSETDVPNLDTFFIKTENQTAWLTSHAFDEASMVQCEPAVCSHHVPTCRCKTAENATRCHCDDVSKILAEPICSPEKCDLKESVCSCHNADDTATCGCEKQSELIHAMSVNYLPSTMLGSA
uniref:Phlebovirus_G2 domain-containing protein n=1 Tax=Panagrellus redivivus TaxID=6233 RepID=A0A7E4UQB9_PANRE